MGDYSELKTAISSAIKANGNGEITGAVLQSTLLGIVNSLGANASFAGIATPETVPDRPDQNVFYLATQAGVYNNFRRGMTLPEGLSIIYMNGSVWAFSVLVRADSDSENLSAYSSNCTLIKASSEIKLALSGDNPKYFLSTTLLATDSADFQISFAQDYFSDSFSTSEIIFVAKCTRATTIRLGNTGGAPLVSMPTTWQVPAGGSIALQFLRTDTLYTLAVPLFITPGALPDVLNTSMPEPEQDVVVYPKGPIGMHSASGMQGLSIDLFHVKSLNFFKHTIYVTDYVSWDPWFTLIDVGDYEIHCVYWRIFMDGESYSNTITYPADGRIENPWGPWPDVSELVKIEIEGFSTTIDSDGNTKKRIIVTVTASGEV